MKNVIVCISVLTCLLFSGCERNETFSLNVNSITDENNFGYNDDQTLRVVAAESYTETDMVIDISDNIVSFKASEFDGRKDLCVLVSGDNSNSSHAITLSVQSGTAEIVTVIGDNIKTLAECGGETKSISKTVEFAIERGNYVVQLVGDNCRDIELTIGINKNA